MKQATPNRPQDFRLLLQQEFVDRCRKNPSYSLRAYARSLGIEASPLSAMLRGKRAIGPKMRQKLGGNLGLGLDEIAGTFEARRNKVKEYQQLTIDTYAVISDWYHYAILELTRIDGFKGNTSYIARTLNISETEAQIAVERLQRIGLLEISESGNWLDTSADCLATNINGSLTSAASRKLQRQILEKGISALENIPIEERNNTSITVALHPDDIPEAKEKIARFRRELCAFFEKNKKPSRVYHLGIALYPVSQKEK